MLNIKINTDINSIPYIDYMSKEEKISNIIKTLIKYKHNGYDLNSIKYDVLQSYNLNENLLLDIECERIVREVENG